MLKHKYDNTKRLNSKMIHLAVEMKNETPNHNLQHEANNFQLAIINCALNVPLMFATITGNALVLITMLTSPSLRSPSIVFLCNLAISDLLVGLVVQPILITRSLHPQWKIITSVYEIFAICFGGVTLLTMTAISVDRYLALYSHMNYPNLVTSRRTVITSITIWFICSSFPGLYLWSQRVTFSITIVIIVLCVFISTVCYLKIYRVVRHHQNQIQQQAAATHRVNDHRGQHVRISKKTAMNTFIYYICMILCYSPVTVPMVQKAFFKNQWTIAGTLADTVVFMNSAINPFLYCWRNRELRSLVSETLRKVLFKQSVGNDVRSRQNNLVNVGDL